MRPPTAIGASTEGLDRAPEQAGGEGLFHAGGSLERFPGAVLLAGPNGIVLDANRAADPIAALLRGGGGDDLLAGKAAQVNPLLLTPPEGAGGSGLAYDVAALPWGDGATALLLARDITLERSLRAALIESRQRYKDLVEAASDFAWETDAQGRFGFVSSRGALGYAAGELIGIRARDLQVGAMPGDDSPFTARVRVQEAELWARQSDGESACLLATALPLFNAEGEWRGARGLCRNITAERRHKARLAVDRHRERLLAYILGILRDEMDPGRMLLAACGALVPALPATGAAIYRHDRGGELICAAQAGELPAQEGLETLLRRVAQGEDEVELAAGDGLLFGKATHFEDAWNGVLCLWRAGAADAWGREDRVLLAEVAAQIGLTNRQVTRQEELEELSSTDPLTGLHNRRSFLAELERRYSRRAGWRGGAALFFLDLDNFKAVNDRHGHQRGDLALVTVARILREQTRSRDLVARLGGDEFALFVEDIGLTATGHKGQEIRKAAAVLESLSGDSDNPLGFSIGVAFCRPDGEEEVDDLMARADRAMYEVKRHGKGDVKVSSPRARKATP
jgi:diguanylate cyclase (GGDEF)-like protein/PAS domain S-box-containing protein